MTFFPFYPSTSSFLLDAPVLASAPFLDSAGLTWSVAFDIQQTVESVQGVGVYALYSDVACTVLSAVFHTFYGSPASVSSLLDWTTIGVTRFEWDFTQVPPQLSPPLLTPRESYQPRVQPHIVDAATLGLYRLNWTCSNGPQDWSIWEIRAEPIPKTTGVQS
jgi:hypothetical protein